MEYCILSNMKLDEVSRDDLDESDVMHMMIEEFSRILNFYKKEKSIQACDDGTFMDIFNFFASRDMDLEATFFAEKHLTNVTEVTSTNVVVNNDDNIIRCRRNYGRCNVHTRGI